MNLVSLSEAFIEFPPFAYHVIQFKEIFTSLEYILYGVSE